MEKLKQAAVEEYQKTTETMDEIVSEKEKEELKAFSDLIGETGIDDMKEDLLDYWDSEGCKEKHGEFEF